MPRKTEIVRAREVGRAAGPLLRQGQTSSTTAAVVGIESIDEMPFNAIDQVIRPLDSADNPARREPVSLKKLRQGDCSWATIKSVLGWVIDTVNMTIHLPPHRIDRLWELLDSIPRHQKRTSVKKWHKVLGELR